MAARKTPTGAWYSPALDPPNMSEKNLALTRLMTVAQGNVGASVLKAGSAQHEYKGSTLEKKYTSVRIHVCHRRSRFLSCMYIHDKFMTESR